MNELPKGLQHLITQIKSEGVQAGEAEKARRLAAAEREAEAIVAKAKERAAAIEAEAEKRAQARATRLEGELRMAARDFTYRFHERLRSQVIGPLAREVAGEALSDPARVASLVADLVRSWGEQGGKVLADPALKQALTAALGLRMAKKAEQGGLAFEAQPGAQGFRLVRQGEHYVWDVSVDAVARELATLVEPELRAVLLPDPASEPGQGFRIVPVVGTGA